MLHNHLTEYITYFRNLALAHKEIKDFVHGPSERIISASRNELEYPCLWLETPSMNLQETDAEISGWRIGAFLILKGMPQDDPQAQDQVWDELEQIAIDVLARMKRDRKNRLFNFDFNGVTFDAVSTLFADNEYGWRVEFKVNKHVNLCYDPDKWI